METSLPVNEQQWGRGGCWWVRGRGVVGDKARKGLQDTKIIFRTLFSSMQRESPWSILSRKMFDLDFKSSWNSSYLKVYSWGQGWKQRSVLSWWWLQKWSDSGCILKVDAYFRSTLCKTEYPWKHQDLGPEWLEEWNCDQLRWGRLHVEQVWSGRRSSAWECVELERSIRHPSGNVKQVI